MKQIPTYILERVIKKISDMLLNSYQSYRDIDMTELCLRKELISCIIGSQIKFESACHIMENINYTGILEAENWDRLSEFQFHSIISSVLSNTHSCLPYSISHRFPKQTANRILQARQSLLTKNLINIIYDFDNYKDMREYLVNSISGIGPKQASMFIRNIHQSNDIAVLDSHIVIFMKMIGLSKNIEVATLKKYEEAEVCYCNYAWDIGVEPGILDRAIWVTMKAAREMS